VRAFTRSCIDRVVAMGEADFVAEVASLVPSFVVADYLGVPESDRSTFGTWSSAIVSANASGNVLSAGRAVGELYGYFTELASAKKQRPESDMISVLLGSEIDGRAVTIEEILGFCFVMIAGGNDTASGLIGGTAALLSRYPGQRQFLATDPSRIPVAVEELLRFLSPVQGLSRTTTTEIAMGPPEGRVTVPAGTKVHLLFASANRDPREFGLDAGELDVTRVPARTLAFSSGPHHCLGAAAARLEGRLVVEELLEAVPDYVVDVDAGRYAPGPFTRRFEYLPIRTSD
jgi:cytochrome P450 family 130